MGCLSKNGMLHFVLHSTASERCCTQNSSKNNLNQPSSAFVFGVLRCLDVYFVYSTLFHPNYTWHWALIPHELGGSRWTSKHSQLQGPCELRKDDPGFRTGTLWLGSSHGWVGSIGSDRTQRLKEVGKSDDFPEFKKVIRWKIPS